MLKVGSARKGKGRNIHFIIANKAAGGEIQFLGSAAFVTVSAVLHFRNGIR